MSNVGSPRPRYLGDVGVWRTSRSDLCPSTYGSPSRRAFWLLDSGSCRSAVRRIGSAPMMIRPPAIPDISGPWLPYNHAFMKPPALDIAYLGVFLSFHSILNVAPGRFVFANEDVYSHFRNIYSRDKPFQWNPLKWPATTISPSSSPSKTYYPLGRNLNFNVINRNLPRRPNQLARHLCHNHNHRRTYSVCITACYTLVSNRSSLTSVMHFYWIEWAYEEQCFRNLIWALGSWDVQI